AVVVRSELGGAFEELGRPLEIALLEEEAGIEIIDLVQVGIERKRTLKFGYRLLMASTKLKSQSAGSMCLGQVGVERQCLGAHRQDGIDGDVSVMMPRVED